MSSRRWTLGARLEPVAPATYDSESATAGIDTETFTADDIVEMKALWDDANPEGAGLLDAESWPES